MTEKRLFLLDAYALIFRAYYAFIRAPRITTAGFNASAVYGFVNTLEEVLRKERPTHIAVCFDPSGPTFRSERYPAYKSEREATPEDIRLSIPFIKEIVKAYRIPLLEVEGFEADDVIGTMARKAEKEGFTTYMMSPDKDFGQLVSPAILQYKPSYRGNDFEIRGEKEVCERYGLERTSQVIDLLALMGDKIDCIPGCPGVGDKTAIKLIQEFGDVETLLGSTDRLKGAMKKRVEENADQIRESKYLATIRTDVPVDVDPESLKVRDADTSKLYAIFRELEFKSLIERVEKRLGKGVAQANGGELPLFDEMPEPAAAEDNSTRGSLAVSVHEYGLVEDAAGIGRLSERLAAVGRCGIVTFADGENDMGADWIGASVAWKEGEAAYIPFSFAEGKAFLLDLLARPDIEKVTPGVKRTYVVAANARGDAETPVVNYFDVTLAHYLLQPEQRHGLDGPAAAMLRYDMHPVPAAAKKGVKTVLAKAKPEELCDWACEMADIALRLRDPLLEAVRKEGMEQLLTEVEMPLAPVLARMELAGVRLDIRALDDAADALRGRLSDLEKEIYALAGEEFNVGSPAKVGEILFDKMQLDPKAKKTKTGQYSTSEDILEKVAHKSPIVGKILEYRQLKKLLTTYLTALPACVNPATGRVHTNYNQTVTATGRISSSNPNLQNIPVREEQGREIRRAFIPDEGHLFLSADYSQIELRLVADFASDPIMLQAFADGDDIHAITASKIYHKDSPQEVTPDERRHAKTANFGILYGISAFGLASRLGIPRADASSLIANYFEKFPSIDKYMRDSINKARENGYTETPMGRRRYLPDINSRNQVVRGYAERNAINAPIQGAAADIIKVAMVAIDRRLREEGLKSRMIMQVHDELNFDVVPEELPRVQEIVEKEMEGAYSGRVRLTASSGVASNWLDAH